MSDPNPPKSSSPPAAPARLARAAKLAIIALGVYLLILNVAVFALIRIAFEAVDNESAENLERLAKRMTEPARDYFWILPYTWDPVTKGVDENSLETYRQLGDWQNLVDSLASLAAEPRLGHADLLTPGGEILLTSTGVVPSAESRRRYLAEDHLAIETAARGEPYISTTSPRQPEKRIYQPVRSREGDVVAILRLEGTAPRGLMTVRNRLFIGFLASFAILVFLWWWTVRLVRRTIDAERAAAQSDRLRALGTMTAGIAHEIRNPLGIIHLQIEEFRALSKHIPDERQQAELLAIGDDLLKETRRLKDLTQSFLDFTRASSALNKDRKLIDLVAASQRTVALWSKGLDPALRTIRFESQLTSASTSFSEDRLRQIFLNLLRNADEAMGREKGAITVQLERAGNMISITVADTGPGIAKETLEQIFDPFFTTRAEGTGLGLSVSRALAEAAGGSLTASSEPGKGATFRLLLPEKARGEDEDRSPFPPAKIV
ncbi:hypothetical protein GC173_07805 [bacterium]|nr:hypothetical protein [bacterium]